jgi:hypothetical protein
MGVLGDTLDEFKKASPQEKVFIVGGAVAAIAILLYVRSQSGGGGSTTSTPATSGTGGTSTSGGIQTVPGPNSSSVPILPPGLNPIFDNNGNLLGYQPITQGTITTTPTGVPTSTNNPANPLIPYEFFPTHKFPTIAGSSTTNVKTFMYNGTNYNVQPGPGGKVYGTPMSGGKQVLLYAPASAYHPNVASGGGPYGTKVLSVHGSRIAPTRERNQSTLVTSLYSSTNRHHR